MDIGDNDDERFSFGAREQNDGHMSKYFAGAIDHVAIFTTSPLDFVVEGTGGDDLIDVAYDQDPEGDRIDALDNDAHPPNNDDLVKAGAGDDTVHAGAGDDTIFGDAGAPKTLPVRSEFDWTAPGASANGFAQDTGAVTVDFAVLERVGRVHDSIDHNLQNVSHIDTGALGVEQSSSFESDLNGAHDRAAYALGFSEPVENVSFRINDIDGDGVVTVKAFDAAGNPIAVNLIGGAKLTLLDTDGVPGADTADSRGGYQPDTSEAYSLLVDIPGPVASIEIGHVQNGHAPSGVNITNVYFDALVPVDDDGGDDVLAGGDGDDVIFGEGGDDLLRGEAGDDTLEGGAGDDTLRGNEGDDLLDGGLGNDSMGGAEGDDTLSGGAGADKLTGGSGDDVLDGGTGDDTLNGSSGNDAITDTDGANLIDAGIVGAPDRGVPIFGQPDADPFDDRDTVTTGAGDDTISTGDDQDVIDASNGDNVIDAGFDDDSVTSGAGDDLIVLGEGSDTVASGGGDDTIFGGTIEPQVNLIDDNATPGRDDPILDNGDDSIDAGAGNDLVFGEDDNDTIDGGTGADTLDGGIDDDTLRGGAGDDLLIGGQGSDVTDGGTGSDLFQVGTFTDPVYGDSYQEGIGDTVIGGEDADDSDTDVLDLTGSGPLKVVFDDAVDPTGTPGESGTVIFYTDASQTHESGRMEFREIESVVPCFTPGTLITTPRGQIPVERLQAGDKVMTRDNGLQEIRWIGSRAVNRVALGRVPALRPIEIKKGALGNGLPERDMVVSPQHRLLVSSEMSQLYFEDSEVLVPAKHLVGRWGIRILDPISVTYVHFMFDQHEVVLSDGAWTESFQPGRQTLTAMGPDVRDEIYMLFPELQTEAGLTNYAAARRSLKAHEAKLLRT